MKVYTYSEARQRLADVLNIAKTEEVVIKRRGGETFLTIGSLSGKRKELGIDSTPSFFINGRFFSGLPKDLEGLIVEEPVTVKPDSPKS